MKSSFCIDLQRFMLIPTKFPLNHFIRIKIELPDSVVSNMLQSSFNVLL